MCQAGIAVPFATRNTVIENRLQHRRRVCRVVPRLIIEDVQNTRLRNIVPLCHLARRNISLDIALPHLSDISPRKLRTRAPLTTSQLRALCGRARAGRAVLTPMLLPHDTDDRAMAYTILSSEIDNARGISSPSVPDFHDLCGSQFRGGVALTWGTSPFSTIREISQVFTSMQGDQVFLVLICLLLVVGCKHDIRLYVVTVTPHLTDNIALMALMTGSCLVFMLIYTRTTGYLALAYIKHAMTTLNSFIRACQNVNMETMGCGIMGLHVDLRSMCHASGCFAQRGGFCMPSLYHIPRSGAL